MAIRQFGHYRLDELLGRGGMGEVYLAYDHRHQRQVAIKLLLESLSSDPEYRARFEREARVVAGLREQHVIPIHNYGEIDSRLYIDMRLVDGEDLGSLLDRERGLELRRAADIVAKVAAALDASHAAGLVHRDVKPANVLIGAAGAGRTDSVYLADFGIARITAASTRLTRTGAAIGTLAYMAPERFAAGDIDHRVDIYALGCVLYEMLCGRKPFPDENAVALINDHLNSAPPRPSAVRPDLPPVLDHVVARSMAKDPADRYPSAGELAAATVSAADGAPRGKGPTKRYTSVQPRPQRTSATTLHRRADGDARAGGGAGSVVTGGSVGGSGPLPARGWPPVAPGRRWGGWFYEVDRAVPQTTARRWPTATDYVQAVQTLAEPLVGSGLRGTGLARDGLGMPVSTSGQNAVVFEISHPAGALALRCFTRSPHDAANRYRALAPVLAAAACDVVAPARWVDSAVDVGGEKWPAVVMPWVPGRPLNTTVEDLLDDRRGLLELAATCRAAVSDLARAGLAHGDLQCGNILVDGSGGLHLVDLDGFYVPGVDRPPAELGHPDFQHPRRAEAHWGPDVDAFSVLVIDLSLRALASDPGLWRFNSAENLVLTREDYQQPGRTPVWAQLRASPDREVLRLAEVLADACTAVGPPGLAGVLAQLDRSDGPPRSLPPTKQERRPAPPTRDVGDGDGAKWWADGTPEAVAPVEPAVRVARTARPGIGALFGRNAVVVGLTAGLACAALIVAVYAAIGSSIPTPAQGPLLIALAGTILTAGLTAIPRATMGAGSTAARSGLLGAVLGLVLSFVGFGAFELLAAERIENGDVGLVLVVGWALCAIAIGVAAGIVRRSGRAVTSGLIGGAVGGLAGGAVHWASDPELVDDGTYTAIRIDVLDPPTLVAILLACAAIGLAIGLVDRVRRRSWLTVIEGRLRGREVILDSSQVLIGTSAGATLRLAGDPAVEPTHAVLSGGRGGYRLACHAAVEVNGTARTPPMTVPLSSGDVLRVGGSFIRFEHRDPR